MPASSMINNVDGPIRAARSGSPPWSRDQVSLVKLRDIKELLTIRDTGVCPCEPAEECCAAAWLIWTPKWHG
jgi:hypothetical protein